MVEQLHFELIDSLYVALRIQPVCFEQVIWIALIFLLHALLLRLVAFRASEPFASILALQQLFFAPQSRLLSFDVLFRGYELFQLHAAHPSSVLSSTQPFREPTFFVLLSGVGVFVGLMWGRSWQHPTGLGSTQQARETETIDLATGAQRYNTVAKSVPKIGHGFFFFIVARALMHPNSVSVRDRT